MPEPSPSRTLTRFVPHALRSLEASMHAAWLRLSIDVLTTPANADVLRHLTFVDEVILHARRRRRDYPRLFDRLAAQNYDAAIDGLVVRPSVNSYTTLLMLATRARWRIGSVGRPHDRVYNIPVAPLPNVVREHHVEHLARRPSRTCRRLGNQNRWGG